MGASAREIERQIKETRERMDDNLNILEEEATHNAARAGRIVAAVAGMLVVAGAAFLIYRRTRKRTLMDSLGGRSMGNLRELSARLKDQLPSVTVKVNERSPHEPGTLESIVRKVAPAVVGTASTALLQRVARSAEAPDGNRVAPQAD
jgi:hypothetical protein